MIKPIQTYYNGYHFRSRLEARWAVFFDALGVSYEYEPEGFWLPNGQMYLPDFRVKCYGKRGELNGKPFDLWIEVKGDCTTEDAKKMAAFTSETSASIEISCPCSDYPHDGKYFTPVLSPRSDYEDHIRRWEAPCGVAVCKYGEERDANPFINCPLGMNAFAYGMEEIINKLLIVGNIPPRGGSHDCYSCGSYSEIVKGSGLYPFNYETIDFDYYGAFPAAHNEKFYLWGDDSNYVNLDDVEAVEKAYDKARQARFEHGETP